jgi:hypothetical protein
MSLFSSINFFISLNSISLKSPFLISSNSTLGSTQNLQDFYSQQHCMLREYAFLIH